MLAAPIIPMIRVDEGAHSFSLLTSFSNEDFIFKEIIEKLFE